MDTSEPNLGDAADFGGSSEYVYSGEAEFLYSSKIREGIKASEVCEVLSASAMFGFALHSNGFLYYKKGNGLRSKQLNIETSITEMGMRVGGHDEFVAANSGSVSRFCFIKALDLFLSDRKLFNSAFVFPPASARIFMRPIAVRAEGDEEYSLFIPYIKVYDGGVVSISMGVPFGFQDLTSRQVIDRQVNRSRLNIESVLCEREFLLACTECQISGMSVLARLAERGNLEALMSSTLSSPEVIEFLDESINTFELVSVSRLTLSDIARNLLSVVARSVMQGSVRTRVNWFGKQYKNQSVGAYWNGKPIIYIKDHTDQRGGAVENWTAHQRFVDSVMARTYLAGGVGVKGLVLNDLRAFDDYNNFFSEPVSLLFASGQVGEFIEGSETYSFNNLKSDTHVLNEVAHFIWMYYSYASLDLDGCTTAIDVARLELEIMRFEESTVSAHKYGEISNYIEEVMCGEYLSAHNRHLHKKIEIVRKSIELDEKVKAESYSRRITIIFGIIASATLSPELMQPLAGLAGIDFADEKLGKLFGIGASVIVVLAVLGITHYGVRLSGWLSRVLKI